MKLPFIYNLCCGDIYNIICQIKNNNVYCIVNSFGYEYYGKTDIDVETIEDIPKFTSKKSEDIINYFENVFGDLELETHDIIYFSMYNNVYNIYHSS